jgi:hypothetical protein
MSEQWLGLDVGGAHLKAAVCGGRTHCETFPLWQRPDDLAARLRHIRDQFPAADGVAVTMTGELADCFADRAEGVRHIVRHCREAFGEACRFYAVGGRLLTAAEAVEAIDVVAASNWHAMGSLAASWLAGPGLMIDVGSTTTDLIPLAEGEVATDSLNDHDRLRRGELIYAGVGRTPICALVDALPLRGSLIPIMNEVFAVTDDCALMSGLVAEDANDRDSCDGRPRTRVDAAGRLARMVGLDRRQITIAEATEMALYVWERLQAQWLVAATALSAPGATWILLGHGQSLVPVPEDRRCLDLAAAFDPETSRVGPAFAVAHLASGAPLPALDPDPSSPC